MSQHNPEDVLKHVKIYVVVFLALAVLTAVTIWASHLQVSSGMHVFVAMLIATIKAGLVAAFFMHLMTEKKVIYSILILTVFFFFILVFITLGAMDSTLGVHL